MSASGVQAASALAIEVKGLHKSYGSVEAVRGIDLRVSRGEVFALLGPNGAGKTTTIEILEGYLQRTAGDVSVLGHARLTAQIHPFTHISAVIVRLPCAMVADA